MKWLILQSNGEHRGQDGLAPNWYFRECFVYQSALENLGHEVAIWGPGHDNYEDRPSFNDFECIVCLENYNNEWVPDFSNSRALKFYSIIDLHFRGPKPYERIARWCDIILHATKRLIPSFQLSLRSKQHIWFPNAVDARFFKGTSLECIKTEDLVFVGSRIKYRQPFLDEVASIMPLTQHFKIGIDMVNIVSGAKIHLNRNVRGDINYRTFETIGIGTCLLTDYDTDLLSLGFADGVNCLLYRDVNEAVAKAKDALVTGDWQRIGREGFRLSKDHNYESRFENLGRSLSIRI